jgi:hypothetical protein
MAPKGRKRGSQAPTAVNATPGDAKRMQRILESMDVQRYEPNVAQQLLEFMHRTRCAARQVQAARDAARARALITSPCARARAAARGPPFARAGTVCETLTEAVALSEHAGRTEVSVEDTRLAAEMSAGRGEQRRRPMPSLLREMAAACNRRNLPEQRKMKQLPPPRDTFVSDGRLRNWQVVVPHRADEQRQARPTYVPAPPPAPGEAGAVRPRAVGVGAPKIQIRLGAAPAAATLNLQDVLSMMAEPAGAVDYDDEDDAAMWDAEQPK